MPNGAIHGPRWLVTLGLLLAMLALAAGCRRESAEQALRRDIASLQAAIESRDARGMAKFLADDFVGNDGLDRDGARRLAAVYFMRNARIGITPGPLDIRLQGDHATLHTTAMLTGGAGGLLPETGRVYAITAGWRMEDGEWRMTSLSWDSP
ncbi:MAG: nuclear transport factor 2 family protein [Luteimonas sp.]|nr:nuclear transport factor 2 family protein [Luteimonas sp.]